MALSQAERLSISKKIVQIPLQNAASDTISGQIEKEKIKAKTEDDANKTLQDDVTVYINGYQLEIERYDGNGRNQLLEQDMLNAADRILQNYFFPNDPNTPTPSLGDGVWKNFIPFARSKAIGKTYQEVYATIQKEQDLITAVSNAITVVESFSDITRSTGQSCLADVISNDTAMQAAGTTLINAIQAWETFLNGTFAIVVTTDTDPTRSAQNIASKADITNSISIIDTWQALTTYNTGHGQTTCAGFNAYNVNLLGPVKFRAAELLPIKNEITARQSFITTRSSQLNTNLGTVVQNITTGVLTTITGFYGQRMRIINTRLNAMGGSLTKYKGLLRGQDAQQQAKDSNDNTAIVYNTVMLCSGFRAPATGTATIHVLNGAGFSIGNTVYIAADNQQEIQTTIVNVSGNTIFLADKIPQKYRQNEFARLYKIL
jgi:hypothetical protein